MSRGFRYRSRKHRAPGSKEREPDRFEEFDEGLCVQVMHLGSYSTEPETMAKIEGFIRSHGLMDRLRDGGKHHETYSRPYPFHTSRIGGGPVTYSTDSVSCVPYITRPPRSIPHVTRSPLTGAARHHCCLNRSPHQRSLAKRSICHSFGTGS
ncbi:MAG: GyrI-like domain-containing protein [Bacillota bacterium]